MSDEDRMTGSDEGTDDRAYFADRAEWHRRRAAIATDGITRSLHDKFVVLYHRRATSGHE